MISNREARVLDRILDDIHNLPEEQMRQPQQMTVAEIQECYAADLDRSGVVFDDAFLAERGIRPDTQVRFTTDSLDRFDSESLAEMRPVVA